MERRNAFSRAARKSAASEVVSPDKGILLGKAKRIRSARRARAGSLPWSSSSFPRASGVLDAPNNYTSAG